MDHRFLYFHLSLLLKLSLPGVTTFSTVRMEATKPNVPSSGIDNILIKWLKGNAPNVFPRTSSTYKADMPIQLKGDARKTAVNLSVTIRKILHVDEVGKSMTVQFQSRRRWLDRQLTFQNLKLSEDLNIDPALSAESGETWFPWIDFYNIESNDKVSVSLLKSPN